MLFILEIYKGNWINFLLLFNMLRSLCGGPFRKLVVIRPKIMKPKKPHSANRKIALLRFKRVFKFNTLAAIIGIGHDLKEFNNVLIRGGRANDLPGVIYKIIRGVFDCKPVFNRKSSPSKYGIKTNFKKS